MKKAALGGLIILALGCGKKDDTEHGGRFERVDLSRASVSAKLPGQLWEEIESLYRPLALDTSTSKEEGVTVRSRIPIVMFPFRILLVEKTRGVLGGRNYEFNFERGGGALDFRDYIKTGKGTFFIQMEHDIELKDATMSVFYLSNSEKKLVGNEDFGMGCNKYAEISSYWEKQMGRGGIPVNVTQQRHIALLGGTYYFAVSHEGRLHVSQLTLRDSRYKHWRCRDE